MKMGEAQNTERSTF